MGLAALAAAFGTLGWLFPYYDSGRTVLALVAGGLGTGGAVLAAGGARALLRSQGRGRADLAAAGIGGSIAAIPGLFWLLGLARFAAGGTKPLPAEAWTITAVLLAPAAAAGLAFAAALLAMPRAAEDEPEGSRGTTRRTRTYAGVGWLAACLATYLATRTPHVRPEETPPGWKALLWATRLGPVPARWEEPPPLPAPREEIASALTQIVEWGTRGDALWSDRLASASRSAAQVIRHPGPPLGFGRWRVMHAAMDGLRSLGPPEATRAVPGLIHHLRALRELQTPRAVYGMQAQTVLSALAREAPDSVFPPLLEALEDPESSLGALQVLSFTRCPVPYLARIAPYLDSPAEESRALAAIVILRVEEDSAHLAAALNALRGALDSSDWSVVRRALFAVQRSPERARPLLPKIRARLSDPDSRIRAQALHTLIAAGGLSSDVMEVLRSHLDSGDPASRVEILREFRFVRPSSGELVALFRELLEDAMRAVRSHAAVNLARQGVRDPALVPVLLEGLNDSDWQLRGSAADSLGGLGSLAREALPALEALRRDPEKSVRESASRATNRIRAMLESRPDPGSRWCGRGPGGLVRPRAAR
ncbi:MAG: HEAT repeat domain-containing protein [Planctomycetales bacterium]|nr:HEAT repeat domain-containing protein [Planctomycetales bacterium]